MALSITFGTCADYVIKHLIVTLSHVTFRVVILPPSPPWMAPKEPCAKYQYILTKEGPKILPVTDQESKDEEAPADYNPGGYLPVHVGNTFKHGRYCVVRKLGYVI
jgi:hypothetical protein